MGLEGSRRDRSDRGPVRRLVPVQGYRNSGTLGTAHPDFSAADAPWRCRSYLSERLHDPGSAEFVEQSTVAAADGYIVVMRVRARNAFNALRLNDYICTLTRSGGLVSIQTLP